MKNYQKLIISIITPLLIGFLGSIFTSQSVSSWYLNINKPFFNPPSWIFGPVWTILYIFIGLAFYYLWQKNNCLKCFYIYFIQLFLNLTWSFFFFGLTNPFLALINIIFLWIAILLSIIWFYPVSKISAYLFIPYFIWVSFATLLNFAIWYLN